MGNRNAEPWAMRHWWELQAGRSVVLLVLFLLMLSSAMAANPKLRRYNQGPLRHSEFRTDAPQAQSHKAKTMTRVMFTYKFSGQQTSEERYEMTLQSLDAFSVFLPNESWWHHRARPSLLDHEQGHFDIAEIAARRLQLAFKKAIAGDKPIRGVGTTAKAAKAALEKKLQFVFDAANEQAVEENLQYDLRTQHGIRHGNQAEMRRIQKLTLARLGEKLSGRKEVKMESSESTGLKKPGVSKGQ